MKIDDFDLPLLDLPHNGTETSILAAIDAAKHAEADRRRIRHALEARGEEGMTCDEIEIALGLSHQTASARLNDLREKLGAVYWRGDKRTTRTGSLAFVYRIVPQLDLPPLILEGEPL